MCHLSFENFVSCIDFSKGFCKALGQIFNSKMECVPFMHYLTAFWILHRPIKGQIKKLCQTQSQENGQIASSIKSHFINGPQESRLIPTVISWKITERKRQAVILMISSFFAFQNTYISHWFSTLDFYFIVRRIVINPSFFKYIDVYMLAFSEMDLLGIFFYISATHTYRYVDFSSSPLMEFRIELICKMKNWGNDKVVKAIFLLYWIDKVLCDFFRQNSFRESVRETNSFPSLSPLSSQQNPTNNKK